MADKSNEKKTLLNLLDRIADALEDQGSVTPEESTERKTILNLLARIAYAIEEGEQPSDLPDVTSDDNGDVLTVVEGEWAKADAPSGLPDVTASNNGQVLMVVNGLWQQAWYNERAIYQEETWEDEEHGTISCSASAESLYGYFCDQGLMIDGSMVVLATQEYNETTETNEYTFTTLAVNNGTVSAITYTSDSDWDSPSRPAS